MACLYCRRKIGPLRKWMDANFCCSDHRRKYKANSARAVREAEDQFGFDENWNERWRLYANKATAKSNNTPSQASAFLMVLAVAFILLAVFKGPGGDSTPTDNTQNQGGPSGLMGGGDSGLRHKIGAAIQSQAPVSLRDDFSTGLAKWEGPKGADWVQERGYVRPGRLRIWKESESLSNYDLEFVGHIEKRSLSWAFRAADLQNYYGSKLTVGKSGPLPNTGLVRFAVLDGRERDRVEVPLPVTLDRNTDYHVRVTVRGNRFLTSIDGQLVSSWVDNRISRGGIGFFSDSGEAAALKWVSVSERDSFWGKLVSHFSLIMFPGVPPDSAFVMGSPFVR